MKNLVAILGYNNTRIDDVKIIRNICIEYFDMDILLCKENLTDVDKSVTPFFVDVNLSAKFQNVKQVISYCQNNNLALKSVLAFSDQGNLLAALLATTLMLPSADPTKIQASINKSDYRKAEQFYPMPSFFKKIKHEKVDSKESLYRLLEESNTVFLKPAQEGNSRGCSVISNRNDIEIAWQNVLPYIEGGIIVEEFIDNVKEFSCDHVGNFTWITSKETSLNEYRAEIQQIVPADINIDIRDKLIECGHDMSRICGTTFHCFHNELFYKSSLNYIYGVEPNIRPAGMRIWNLAMIAFKDFNPWLEWINSSLVEPKYEKKDNAIITQVCYAGIRMIKANRDGNLLNVPVLKLDKGIVEVIWTKKIGDLVFCNPKDNSQFVGYIIGKSNDYANLSNLLLETQTKLSNLIEVC